ncbi:MAG: DUF4214 domain-containing protein [Bdellovibrionales bacterium]|nr:DUF4214 domain-containing protein [Bdellovibrionales bacterium]
MIRKYSFSVFILSFFTVSAWATDPHITDDLTISKTVLGSPLSIRSADQFAGAIDSLIWKGVEFINRYDHGRQLQSASSFDGLGECFNPTEAGRSADQRSVDSTSVLLRRTATGNYLETTSQMAFWLRPNQSYPNKCGSTNLVVSQNTTALSDHRLTKRVAIGYKEFENVIDYQVTYHVPEARKSATFEALTGYMPPTFSVFSIYNTKTDKVEALSDGPGEQAHPVILSTSDGSAAMAVISPLKAGYGRWRFVKVLGPTNKWNCVFRETSLKAGDFTYKCLVVVGSLAQVTDTVRALSKRFQKTPDLSTPVAGASDIAPVYSSSAEARAFKGREQYVEMLYRSFLGRPSEPAGRAWHVDVIKSWGCATDVRIFADSPEFNAYRAASDLIYVTALYNATLFRAPDTEGLNFHLDLLRRKLITRDRMLEDFLASREFTQTCKKYNF